MEVTCGLKQIQPPIPHPLLLTNRIKKGVLKAPLKEVRDLVRSWGKTKSWNLLSQYLIHHHPPPLLEGPWPNKRELDPSVRRLWGLHLRGSEPLRLVPSGTSHTYFMVWPRTWSAFTQQFFPVKPQPWHRRMCFGGSGSNPGPITHKLRDLGKDFIFGHQFPYLNPGQLGGLMG